MASGSCPTSIASPSASAVARLMQLSSSRTLNGQSWCSSATTNEKLKVSCSVPYRRQKSFASW